jgi:DNA-directed RNA polymerase specialized sigma24 family protein
VPTEPRQFETTHWSLVVRAGREGLNEESQRRALADLIRRYLPALRAHLMYRRRLEADAADDMLQAFVTEKVLEQGLVGEARQHLGRFRMFLLAAMDRFVVSQIRKQRAKKRSAPGSVPIDEHLDAADDSALAPDERIDIAWARELLNQALCRMRRECEVSGRSDVWGIFEGRLLNPILHQAEPIGYDGLVARFKLASPAQASNVLMTAKRAFARSLRELIGEYERNEEQIEAEISELMTVLSRARD